MNSEGQTDDVAIFASATTKLNDLLAVCSKTKMKTVEDLCHTALNSISGSQERQSEKTYTSTEMLAAGLLPLDVNFNIRFSRQWEPSEKVKKSSSLFGLGALGPSDYENITSEKILYAPITDICLVQRSDPTPEGFYRISRTTSNKRADLNTGSGGNHLYLCIKKELQGDNSPITSLIVIYPDKKEYVPPGFSVVKRGGKPCNLNSGTNAERIYLCFKRDNSCNPIIDLQVYFPTKSEFPPISFSKLARSTRNFPVDLNLGTGAQPISLCFRYTCSNLNFLVSDLTLDPLEMLKEDDQTVISKVNRKSLDRRLSAQSSLGVSDEWEEKDLKKVEEEKDLDLLEEDTFSVQGSETRTPRLLSDDPLPTDTSPFDHRQGSTSSSTLRENSDNETLVSKRLSSATLHEVEARHSRRESGEGSLAEGGYFVEDDNVSISAQSNPEFESNSPRLRRYVVTSHDEPIPVVYGQILRAILTGLFTTGEVFDSVLDIMQALISEDTLLKPDFLGIHPESESLTMLDVLVGALCERLDCCVEVMNNRILDVINAVILKSGGKLSKYATQIIFKGLTFVCSAFSSRIDWILSGACHPVLEDGKDVSPFLVLRQLIKSVTSLAEESPVEHFLPATPLDGEEEGGYYNLGYLVAYGESFILVSDIVTEFIDEVMEAVEISKVTETALLTIAKKNFSIFSPSFWVHINEISKNLFRSYQVQNAFILLSGLCKWSWMELKNTPNGDVPPRHIGNKLFSIEALREFCRVAGPQLRASKIMGYQIRRLIVSSIFVSMQYSMSQPRIFLKLLQVVSCLWENWREHIRLEFPVLCEQLIIKILHAPTTKMPPLIHLIALIEVTKWFEQPHMLVEMFVNFDMDVVVAADWNIFSHLIRAVCSFAEKASRPTIPGGPSGPFPSEISSVGSLSSMFGANYIQVQPRDVKIKALEVVATITRAMMDATGHANLIYMDIISHDESSQRSLNAPNDDDDEITDGETSIGAPGPGTMKRRISYSITNRRAISLQSAELLQQAIKIYQEKESVGKAVKFLVSKNFMSDTPHEIAGFVRIYKDSFDPASIGDFLGEGGRNRKEEEYWNAIRDRYTRAVSFVDLHVYDALRLYLTGCGFRMPGEAQKIDRFISAFVKVYWQDNRGTEYCPFNHEDTVHLLAYAIIMLNTDLHRANIDKKKGGKKMSKTDFIRNLRGADQGSDINSDYLGHIYDDIAAMPIEMEVKEQNNTLKETAEGSTTDIESHKRFVAELLRNLRSSGDLMRSLSPYTHMFHIVGVNINISMELVSFMFESVWHHFHAIVDGILTKMNNEENIIFSALDVLCNSLTSCIFLNLKVEKLAFATQLARFRQICEAANVEDVAGKPVVTGANFASGLFRQEKWFMSVESSTAETAIAAIAEVHTMVVHLKDLVRQCARREATKIVFSRIEKRANLNDGVRFFIMEGDLKKKNRSGRFVQYRFFLFSDCLVYAHQGFSEFKVHGQLNLDSTVIDANVKDDAQNCCFIVDNPTKTFVVMAESHYDKQLWVRSINDAISSCEHRRRGRRLSILDRMESQEKEVTERQILHETLTSKPQRQSNLRVLNHSNSGSSDLRAVPEVESSPFSEPEEEDRTNLTHVRQRLPFQDIPSSQPEEEKFSETLNDPMIFDRVASNQERGRKVTESPIQSSHFSEDWISEEPQLDSADPSPVNHSLNGTPGEDSEECSVYLSKLDSKSLATVFLNVDHYTNYSDNKQGLKRWKILLDSKSSMEDATKLKLYGLYRLAKDGTAPSLDESLDKNSVQYKQLKAWSECGTMSTAEAQCSFIVTLSSVCPEWEYSLPE